MEVWAEQTEEKYTKSGQRMKLILLLAFLPFITSFPFLPLLTTPPARPTALSASAERTYIMIKPDGVQRGLIGDIIKRFEDKGLTMLGCKVRMANGGLLEEHYKDLVDKVSLPSFNQVLFCSIVHFISSFFSLFFFFVSFFSFFQPFSLVHQLTRIN